MAAASSLAAAPSLVTTPSSAGSLSWPPPLLSLLNTASPLNTPFLPPMKIASKPSSGCTISCCSANMPPILGSQGENLIQMARTKQTAKKVGPVSKKVFKGKGKGKSFPLPKKITVRRFSQGVRCLREIRKAQKALSLAIPKLPFQRLCREICDERKIELRWQRTALECNQEVAEDFLIEFFQDSYIYAAHAKRVTLMDKGFVTLRRLRYRFNKLFEPLPFTDEKTFNILNIPPYRKPKLEESKIKIEDVTHEKDTRTSKQSQAQREDARDAKRRKDKLKAQKSERDKLLELEAELPALLGSINPEGFIVRAFVEEDIDKRDDYISLDTKFMTRLKSRKKELNDTLVLAALRMTMHDFSLEI